MALVMDYLAWRGDVPFFLSPLNDVDHFLICKIGTPDLSGCVPADARYVPLHQAVEEYFSSHEEGKLGVIASPWTTPMVHRLPQTVRFGALELSGYRNIYNEERTEQFSALTVRLPEGSHIVTFRGTDDTIVAWKEDFRLAVMDEVPAQKSALEYLEWAASAYPGELILSGHSKGGNLALYAAVHASPETRQRIKAVYCFDAPGFQTSFFEKAGFKELETKVRNILSQHAMVGTLFSRTSNCTIVRSSAFGMAAHDGFTWETTPAGFVLCESFAPASMAFDEAMQSVLDRMSLPERTELIESFFGALSSTGAVTLSELSEQNFRQALSLLGRLQKEPEVRKLVRGLMGNMARCYAAERKNLSGVRGRRKKERESVDTER